MASDPDLIENLLHLKEEVRQVIALWEALKVESAKLQKELDWQSAWRFELEDVLRKLGRDDLVLVATERAREWVESKEKMQEAKVRYQQKVEADIQSKRNV